jgi:hypothetical protein
MFNDTEFSFFCYIHLMNHDENLFQDHSFRDTLSAYNEDHNPTLNYCCLKRKIVTKPITRA